MNAIDKYIKTERDIAEYRVQMLERSSNRSLAKNRLLDREIEFLNIPFSSLGFETVDDLSFAINLYRTSRFEFYEKYGCYDVDKLVLDFENRLEYLLDKRDEFLGIRVQEINVIQNKHFYNKLIAESKKGKGSIDIKESSISDLLKIESASISKERARVQAIIYSAGLYLEEYLRSISLKKDPSPVDIYKEMKQLDCISGNLKNELFKYYNQALEELPDLLRNTMGRNNKFHKIHRLNNVLDSYPIKGGPLYKSSGFNSSIPQIGYILFGIKQAVYSTVAKDQEKETKNRVYGILLPIKRIGNEKLSLLYKRIIYKNDDITHLFSDTLSNVKATNTSGEIIYFKSLMVNPLWEILSEQRGDNSVDILSSILGVEVSDIKKDLDSLKIASRINKTCTNFLDLSIDDSIILVAKTRSEESRLQTAINIANEKLNDVCLISATND